MLAYAPRSHRAAVRPRTMILIVAGHLFVLGAVMSAKLDIPERLAATRTKIFDVPLIKDPPPVPANTDARPDPAPIQTSMAPIVDLKPLPSVDQLLPSVLPSGPVEGSGMLPTVPEVVPTPLPPHQMVRTGARLATADDRIRPPYPASKRDLGEEATLQLTLTIDDHGRVIAVEPVGRADPSFLASARAHILRAWRFEPATEDGRPVASTKTISLRFEIGEGEA
ncbi:MAG: energy transducer TonB [Sphingomicrobium sp.]